MQFPSNFFSFVSVHVMHTYSRIDTTASCKKLRYSAQIITNADYADDCSERVDLPPRQKRQRTCFVEVSFAMILCIVEKETWLLSTSKWLSLNISRDRC